MLTQVGAGVVLLYHRVGRADADPWELTVSVDHFAEHMEVLRRDCRLVSLQDLVHGCGAAADGPRVAITFDDGYAETVTNVLPILERFEIPATLFIPSGSLDATTEFWWDELESLLLAAGELPQRLVLDLGDRNFEWNLGVGQRLTHRQADEARGWATWQEPPPGVRQALYLELWHLCQRLPTSTRAQVLAQLRGWSGRDGQARPGYRALRAAELATLASQQFVEIGAHTVTHSSLSSLPASEQADEVLTDKRTLERITRRPVSSFAYPFGKGSDYTPETAAIVRDAGFTLACVNICAAATASTDRFEVPRLFVPDCSGEALAQKVESLLGESCERSR